MLRRPRLLLLRRPAWQARAEGLVRVHVCIAAEAEGGLSLSSHAHLVHSRCDMGPSVSNCMLRDALGRYWFHAAGFWVVPCIVTNT
jgi:hypothetical protein